MDSRFKKILVFYIILISISASVHSQLPIKINLSKEGEVILNNDYKSFTWIEAKSGRLQNNSKDCVAIVGKTKFLIFKYLNNNLEKLFESNINFSKITMGPSIPKLVVGNFNNKLNEEVLICLNNKILIFEWIGSQFKRMEYDFPYYIYDCVSGDVTNDGIDDVVVACLSKPIYDDPNEPVYEGFRIVVFNIKKAQLEIIYDKIGEVKIGISTIIPPDKLVCIADIENVDKNKLISSMAQSDVSPTQYIQYFWNSNNCTFNLQNKFKIVNNKIHDSKITEMQNYSCGKFKSIIVNTKTYIIANVFGRVDDFGSYSTSMILKFENNTEQHMKLPFDFSSYYRTNVKIQTGTQEGIMYIAATHSVDDNTIIKYKYYEIKHLNNYLFSEKFSNLENKSLAELRLLRNELFARHGHSFSDTALTKYFKKYKWYEERRDLKVNVNDLTQDERKMLDTILLFEQNKKNNK